MGVKIKNFVIQAKVNEEQPSNAPNASLAIESVQALKAEILDECLDKMRELIAKEKSRV
tara:strand:- start:205 stop:381 length:177 start_codon:yes stop_codon:yes gene_type:complete